MLEKKFNSIFKDELSNFIKYKRSSGIDFIQEVYRLLIIDKILVDMNLQEKVISKDTFELLTLRRGKENQNYAYQYRIVVNFCKYLNYLGYKNIYFKSKKFRLKNNYIPTIFNDIQMNKIFNKMDELAKINDDEIYYTYSIIFRLLYSCGLRIEEVININFDDVIFDENSIYIKDSKEHSSRIIAFSNSMKICLMNYIEKLNISSGFLFSYEHKKLKAYKMRDYYYNEILSPLGLPISHIHDLRHSFVNKAFMQMLEKGYDEYTVIIYLYKYMGHKNIEETLYYMHFTPEVKNKIIELNSDFSNWLYEGKDLNDK